MILKGTPRDRHKKFIRILLYPFLTILISEQKEGDLATVLSLPTLSRIYSQDARENTPRRSGRRNDSSRVSSFL